MTVRNQYQLPLCIHVASVVEISWLLIQLPTDPIVRVWPIAESLAAKICWKVSRRLGYHGIDFYINLKVRESVQDLFRFVVMWIRFRLNLKISSRVLLLCFLLRCLSMSFPRANELLKAQRDIYCTCTQHKRAFIPGCIEVAFHHDLDWCLNHMLNFWNLMDEKVCIAWRLEIDMVHWPTFMCTQSALRFGQAQRATCSTSARKPRTSLTWLTVYLICEIPMAGHNGIQAFQETVCL